MLGLISLWAFRVEVRGRLQARGGDLVVRSHPRLPAPSAKSRRPMWVLPGIISHPSQQRGMGGHGATGAETLHGALAPGQTHWLGEQPAATAKPERVPLKARTDLNVCR